MRLIQLSGANGRRLGVVDGERIRLLRSHHSIYALALAALAEARRLPKPPRKIQAMKLSTIRPSMPAIRPGVFCPRWIIPRSPRAASSAARG